MDSFSPNFRELATRQMGVYGFCSVLKHLRDNSSRRNTSSITFSQPNISGYSLMSQSILNTEDNPQRHFDMLALEIIGVLRKCLNQSSEIKIVLYEGKESVIFSVYLCMAVFNSWIAKPF